jgi:ADP-ribosyl-[dinitrogen reductase] hydrolase
VSSPRTSVTHPIRVDFLPGEAVLGPARLGMTFAPGKRAVGIEGRWERDLDADLARLRDEYGMRVLVSLVEPHELGSLGIKKLPAIAAKLCAEFVAFPIPDAGIPSSMGATVKLVEKILEHLRLSRTVVIHCRGGLGRTGLVAACCLTALGHEHEAAIALVRAARPGAIETAEQARFVGEFAAQWNRVHTDSKEDATRIRRRRDRWHGCLLGGALGDALGYPVEFTKSWKAIESTHGRSAPERLAYAGEAPAVITDDTQMTLFVAEGFIRAVQRYNDRGICHPPGVIRNALLRWYATQVPGVALSEPQASGWLFRDARLHHRRDPGNTNLSALEAQCRGAELPDVHRPPNDSKGCGAIMRSAPLGLGCRDMETAFEMARDTAVITHGHPSGYLSAAYFAAVIHGVARGAALPAAMRVADALLEAERDCRETVDAIRRAREVAAGGVPSPEAIESLGGGWVGEEALAIALACALTAEGSSPEATAAALWRSAVHAGDSDSTASLTGNLLGAMHGTACLPSRWLEDLELRDVVERVAEDLFARTVLGRALENELYPPV